MGAPLQDNKRSPTRRSVSDLITEQRKFVCFVLMQQLVAGFDRLQTLRTTVPSVKIDKLLLTAACPSTVNPEEYSRDEENDMRITLLAV
jgi:hypothetical protein